MAKATGISTKRLLIDKANTRIVLYVSVATVVFIFSAVATKTFISQANYQNKIIGAKRDAVKQLKSNIAATTQLRHSYAAFVGTPQNAIGGSSNGIGNKSGDNAKIILDALPVKYDFPALTTSLESLLGNAGVEIDSIAGTDDEIAQSGNGLSATPTPLPIPFSMGISGDYAAIQRAVDTYQRSIRPIQIQTLDIAGVNNELTLSVTAQTYYQPAKTFNISQADVNAVKK